MAEKTEKNRKSRKKRSAGKRILGALLVLLLIGGAGVGVYILFFRETPREAITAETTYGALDRSIEGSGTTTPTESLAITPVSSAEIKEVFVKAGDMVEVGTLLYTQDDSEVDDKIESLEEQILEKQDEIAEHEQSIADQEMTISDTYEKIADYNEELAEISETMASLTVRAPFAGTVTGLNVEVGKNANNGTALATLTDNTTLELIQYFSYAYVDMVTVGMAAQVTPSGALYTLDGQVTAVEHIEWVSGEGMKCFAVTVTFPNPGSLTENTAASSVLLNGSVKIYPAADGTMQYKNAKNITAEASGEVTAVYVSEYDTVTAGQTLFVIDGESYRSNIENVNKQITNAEKQITNAEKQITNLQKKITTANEKIAELTQDIADAEESRADYAMTSEISGKVMYVNIEPGDKPSTMMTALTIYNLDTMNISVNFDELDVDYISEGTPVTITRTSAEKYSYYDGVITYLSPEASSSSGVATFAATIEIASGGELSSGVSVSYKISLGDSEEGVLAPVSALKSNDGQYYLYVKSDTMPENAVPLTEPETEVPDGFYAVPVEVGSSNAQYIRILSGVEEGVTVFTRYRQTAPSGGDVTSNNGEEEGEFPFGDMGNMGDMFGSGGMPSFGGENGSGGGRPGGSGGNSGGGGGMPSFSGGGGGRP